MMYVCFSAVCPMGPPCQVLTWFPQWTIIQCTPPLSNTLTICIKFWAQILACTITVAIHEDIVNFSLFVYVLQWKISKVIATAWQQLIIFQVHYWWYRWILEAEYYHWTTFWHGTTFWQTNIAGSILHQMPWFFYIYIFLHVLDSISEFRMNLMWM